MIDNNETIAAIATPPGRGGIGVIRISGPAALHIATSITGKPPRPRQAAYCSFRAADGTVMDRGVVLFFARPASYTGEDVVELQGHGGQAVLNLVLKQTLALGARLARPGEFTERAFLNNKIDLLQAEATADLIDSLSEQAARSSMRSLDGEFSSRIDALLNDLISIRVFIEGALDFPEEEIDFISSSNIKERTRLCLEKLDTILLQARNGKILRDGICIAIIGPPNAGKSSLLNVLTQTNRAIVTPSPGTTRDVIEERILLDGLPLSLFDTAGIRDTTDEIEQEGIKRARLAAARADLVLYVREAEPKSHEQQADHAAPPGTRQIIINNKIDLVGIKAQIKVTPGKDTEVFLSAKTREGIPLLEQQIKDTMGVIATEEGVLSARTRHIDALLRAQEMIIKVLESLQDKNPATELLAEDLLQAQQFLELVTGKSTPDDLLGEIFSSFCIGK